LLRLPAAICASPRRSSRSIRQALAGFLVGLGVTLVVMIVHLRKRLRRDNCVRWGYHSNG
ncbi:hypothetical protein CEXT_195571, partial [Caerostris extrusa]